MIKLLRLSLMTALLAALAPGAYANCSVNDFLVGANPGIAADACISGRDFVWDIESNVESWQGPGLSLLGSNVNTWFGDIELGVDVDPLNNGFQWEMSDPSSLNGFNDAIFVVKEGSPLTSGWTNQQNDGINWVAYLATNISETFGSFFTENSFNTNNYDILAVYGKEGGNGGPVHSVPEIDGASAGIVFSLLLGLIAIIRERRVKR